MREITGLDRIPVIGLHNIEGDMDTSDWTATEHKPDWLDRACTRVFDAMENVPMDKRIMVLEQCIDYTKQELAELESEREK